jgi:hypothetical protein
MPTAQRLIRVRVSFAKIQASFTYQTPTWDQPVVASPQCRGVPVDGLQIRFNLRGISY